MSLIDKYIQHIKKSIHNAEKYNSKLIPELFHIEGMTGKKTKHFYNNLLELDNVNYLEIGCYKGSSTCASLYKNSANVVCIDNWHDFLLNQEHNNIDSKPSIDYFLQNIENYKGKNTIAFYNEDCFQINTYNLPIFNIYLYDGDHTYESQYNALKYYIDNMEDVFIYLVDDWNDEPVRQGTFDAIRDLKLENVWNYEIRLTNNNTHTPHELAHETWWNGLYICILQKNVKLVYYDNLGYYTDDIGYIEGIPIGIAEPYPSDLAVIQKYINTFTDKCNTYIDIGAHIGTTCIPLSRIYTSVVGFEVNRNNFNLLARNVALNKMNNITINNFGLYNEDCLCDIYQHKENASGCFYLKKNANGKIRCMTLDTYCENNNITNIDYIKIDTEGSELYVLEGSLQIIQKYKPLISIESNGLSDNIYNIKEHDIYNFFANNNYIEYEKSGLNIFFIYNNK